jgi:hypothetical protein
MRIPLGAGMFTLQIPKVISMLSLWSTVLCSRYRKATFMKQVKFNGIDI